MEKSRARTRAFRAGLLALLLPLKTFSQEQAPLFIPAQEFFFTSSDCVFELIVPGAEPGEVQVTLDKMPQDVSFSSMRKESVTGESAAKITAVFKCAKSMTLILPPARATVRGKRMSVPFQSVQVYDDPRLLKPELSVSIPEENFMTGDHIVFTVSIRYAVQVLDIAWDLPEDAIFTETARYEITEPVTRGAEFYPDEIPVISFDWQPLTAGSHSIPGITVTATSYGGAKVEAAVPRMQINVEPQKDKSPDESPAYSGAFAYAFTRAQTDNGEEETISISAENVEALSKLRSKERHSLPFSKARKIRARTEEALGMVPGANEPSVPLTMIILLSGAAALTLGTILLAIRKKSSGTAILIISMMLLALSLGLGIQAGRKTALFAGGTVSAVPEENLSTGVPLEAARRVYIQELAGEWAYIRFEETYGWVKKDTLFFIE